MSKRLQCGSQSGEHDAYTRRALKAGTAKQTIAKGLNMTAPDMSRHIFLAGLEIWTRRSCRGALGWWQRSS